MNATIHGKERKCTRVPLAGKPLSYWKNLADKDVVMRKEPRNVVNFGISEKELKERMVRMLREEAVLWFKGYMDCLKDADSPDINALLHVGLDHRDYQIKWMSLEKAKGVGVPDDLEERAFTFLESLYMNNQPIGITEMYHAFRFFMELHEMYPGLLAASEKKIKADQVQRFYGTPHPDFTNKFSSWALHLLKEKQLDYLEPNQILATIELVMAKFYVWLYHDDTKLRLNPNEDWRIIAKAIIYVLTEKKFSAEEKKKALKIIDLFSEDEQMWIALTAINQGVLSQETMQIGILKRALGCKEDQLTSGQWKLAVEIWKKAINENPENVRLIMHFPFYLRPKLISTALKSKDPEILLSAVMQAQDMHRYINQFSFLQSFYVKSLLRKADKIMDDLIRIGVLNKTSERTINLTYPSESNPETHINNSVN